MSVAGQDIDYRIEVEEALVVPTNPYPCRNCRTGFDHKRLAHYSWGKNMSAA
jgi:hypothetical protein